MAKTYFHVFAVVKGESLWWHEFSADTRDDADCEVDGLKCQGYRTKIIRSTRQPLDLLAELRGVKLGLDNVS
jgi:hypothetical protein